MSFKAMASGFDAPVVMAQPDDGTNRIFIGERDGRVKILRSGINNTSPYLDISDLVGKKDGQGLLGLAFPKDFKVKKIFFLSYTDLQGDTVIAQFKEENATNSDKDSMKVVLKIVQSSEQPNSGTIQFGPDGFLYVSSGDGGIPGDPERYAQSLQSMLGKILRIDVSGDGGYTIPKDNPLNKEKDTLHEIWAYGFRDPRRFSFDKKTGELLLGDIGQVNEQEIDVVEKRKNYGWSLVEGKQCFVAKCKLANYTAPIISYGKDQGTHVIGGYVYRGQSIPEANGYYFFGDQISNRIWAIQNDKDSKQMLEVGKLKDQINSFGEDSNGELYVLTQSGSIFKMDRSTS